MRAQFAAGAGGSTVAAPTLKPQQAVFSRVGLESLPERALRFIGRVLLGVPPSTWMLVDISILLIGVFAAFTIFPPPQQLATPHVEFWQASAVFALAVIIASLVFGLYERETIMSRSRILTRIGLTASTATVLAYAVIYIVMYATVSRRVSALAMSLFLGGGAAIRLGAWWVAHRVHCGLLVVGSRALFESFKAAQDHDLLHEYRLLGYATSGEDSKNASNDASCVGTVAEQIE